MSFDPMEHDREPREEGWKEETERFKELLDQRRDLRIGQLIINAIENSYDLPDTYVEEKEEETFKEYKKRVDKNANERLAEIEGILWSIEADELVDIIEDFLDE